MCVKMLSLLLTLAPLVSPQTVFDAENVAEMARTPFILTSGELYRDLLTLETSKLAAQFAKSYQPQVKQMARKHKMLSKMKKLMTPLPNFIERRAFDKGIQKDDAEIFDFTDSRFVNPPTSNRQNFPLVKEEVPLAVPIVESSKPLQFIDMTHYSPAPTTPHTQFTRFTPDHPHPTTPRPLTYSSPRPAYYSTPPPPYRSKPQQSYFITTQSPLHNSSPHFSSYHPTPQPDYQPQPLDSYQAKPPTHSHHFMQSHLHTSSYTTPKPFVNLGSREHSYAESYSHRPSGTLLSTPAYDQGYSFYPTPAPSYPLEQSIIHHPHLQRNSYSTNYVKPLSTSHHAHIHQVTKKIIGFAMVYKGNTGGK